MSGHRIGAPLLLLCNRARPGALPADSSGGFPRGPFLPLSLQSEATAGVCRKEWKTPAIPLDPGRGHSRLPHNNTLSMGVVPSTGPHRRAPSRASPIATEGPFRLLACIFLPHVTAPAALLLVPYSVVVNGSQTHLPSATSY